MDSTHASGSGMLAQNIGVPQVSVVCSAAVCLLLQVTLCVVSPWPVSDKHSKYVPIVRLSSSVKVCKHEAPVLAQVKAGWQQVHSSHQGKGWRSVPGSNRKARRSPSVPFTYTPAVPKRHFSAGSIVQQMMHPPCRHLRAKAVAPAVCLVLWCHVIA